MTEEQYKLICARRNAFNQLLWQVPTLATATQAFLLAAAFNPVVDPLASVVLAGFSCVTGLASIQLMAKHRYLEMTDSQLLLQHEMSNADKGFSVLHGPLKGGEGIKANWFVRLSSFRTWIVVLCGFCMLAIFSFWHALDRHEERRRAVGATISTQAKQP